MSVSYIFPPFAEDKQNLMGFDESERSNQNQSFFFIKLIYFYDLFTFYNLFCASFQSNIELRMLGQAIPGIVEG